MQTHVGGLCQIEIPVRDLKAALQFYDVVFGWKPVPAEMLGYVVIDVPKDSPYGISLTLDESAAGDTGRCPTFYFATPDPVKIIDLATGAGGKKRFGPKVVPGYGTIWQFTDPDGNRFGLFQVQPKV